jgi:hypothetical protein
LPSGGAPLIKELSPFERSGTIENARPAGHHERDLQPELLVLQRAAAAEQPAFVAKAAVWRRIAEAQSGGTREIVLTGGEPTLRSDLADLVRRAAAAGARGARNQRECSSMRPERANLWRLASVRPAVQLVAWGDEARRRHYAPAGRLRRCPAGDPRLGRRRGKGRGDRAGRTPQPGRCCGAAG